jgi:transcriptional regulator with XRE-family HTH domain
VNTLEKSELAKRLEELRELNGWTKTLVANKLGLKNMATYANWEYGTREPDTKALVDLASMYGVTVDYLLNGDNSSKKYSGLSENDVKDDNVKLIASHIDDDVTEKDMEDILKYIELIKKSKK